MTWPSLLNNNPLDGVPWDKVSGISIDSRRVVSGHIFVAIKGVAQDGHMFASQAQERGALLVVAERPLPDVSIPVVLVPCARTALHRLCQCFYGDPFARMKVTAVTGTNGKTSITYILEAILQAAGCGAGVLGTINYRAGTKVWASEQQTTPGPPELYQWGRHMQQEGVTHIVLEASSHGLKQDRLAGLSVDVAIFTNLTRDHMDYHPTIEDYAASKKKLFDGLTATSVAVVNGDDAYSAFMVKDCKAKVWTYGLSSKSDCSCVERRPGFLRVRFPDGVMLDVQHHLVGAHNVSNVLAALCAAWAYGIPTLAMQRGLAQLAGVPGRLESCVLAHPRGIRVYVDYAHTPDALARVLLTLREEPLGKLIVVFGCGGDRDRGKRPMMAAMAEQGADVVVVTSDNPRSENPESIIRDICEGFSFPQKIHVKSDRKEAIQYALKLAGPNDVVLIAGKGHESYQEIAGVRHPHSDQEIVRFCI